MSTPAGFVGRQSELRILGERLAAAEMGHPQVVYVEGEAGGGKSTLLSRFLGSLADAVVLQVGGDEAETLLSYGVIDQLQPGVLTEPGTDPMAVGVRLLDLFDRLQSGGQVVVLAIDDLQWVDRPSARAVLFALRRLRADKVLAVVSTRAGGLADPGWARFVGGDSRVTRIRLGGLSPGDLTELAERAGAGSAVAARGVSVGGPYRRQRAVLPGVAGGDRRCPAERGGRSRVAGAAGAVRGDPGPRGSAPGSSSVFPGGSFGAGAARAGLGDRVGCPVARCAERGGCGGRSRTADRRCLGAGAGLCPSAVPGGDLRRSQPGEPPGTARAGRRGRGRQCAAGPPGCGVAGP